MRIILLLMHTILLATIKYIFSTISFDAPFIELLINIKEIAKLKYGFYLILLSDYYLSLGLIVNDLIFRISHHSVLC